MSQAKAVQKAREAANEYTGKMWIVYHDPHAREYFYCTYEAFERLLDMGDVSSQWIYNVYCR